MCIRDSPKFDPAPTDAPVDPSGNFEFDFNFDDDVSIDKKQVAAKELELPSQRHSTGTSSRTVAIVAAVVGLLLISVIGWFAFG